VLELFSLTRSQYDLEYLLMPHLKLKDFDYRMASLRMYFTSILYHYTEWLELLRESTSQQCFFRRLKLKLKLRQQK